jgi:1-pyrroline-5-carboxylate dehydrogenase
MINAINRVPYPENEALRIYHEGSREREQLKAALSQIKTQVIEIPLIIGGREVKTDKMGQVVMPHRHRHVLAHYHMAGEAEIDMAIEASMTARRRWHRLPWPQRMAVFLKAAS